MQFELSSPLIDEIIFFMEDQSGEFFLDTREGIVIGTDDEEYENESDEDRYISLPEWEPSDGFRLMESFTARLHNPVAKGELSSALDRGRGVFRAFKDVISQYPEIEKLWFDYKDRQMKRGVIGWYNALRESWGLELIGEEPDDIDGLAQEDFQFRPGCMADKEAAEKLHRLCTGPETSGGDDKTKSEETSPWVFPGEICIAAESSGGEFAAYVSSVYTAPGRLCIRALEVTPEYRGLGLGKALLARLLEQADSKKIPVISIDLPAASENFSHVLYRESFKPKVVRYCRSLPST
jgi:GNAT superfamily N-acetyltransferase